MRRIIFVFALLCLLGSNCSKQSSFLSTKLDHISSATVVNCDAYEKGLNGEKLSLRTCLVIANPFWTGMSVYDASQASFLLSPIGYSPLAVRVPGFTTQLLSFEKPGVGYVFAFDANVSQLSAISTRNVENGPVSFSSSVQRAVLTFDKGPDENLRRPLKLFVTNPKGPGKAQILASYNDGTLRTSDFDDANPSFSTLQTQVTSLQAQNVIDTVYDAGSGLIAFLTTDGITNKIVVRKAVDTNPNTATFEEPNVGNVKMALGMFKTSDAASPHLLIMRQDAPRLRTIRLDGATLSKEHDREIKLQHIVTAAYIPQGQNETCCGGVRDWVSVSSDDGIFYYLTNSNLINDDENQVFSTTMNLSRMFNLPAGSLRGLSSLIGGDVLILAGEEAPKERAVCWRQMYFVFGSGFIAGLCEGRPNGATQIVSRDTGAGT